MINGLPIVSVELKSHFTSQNVQHAIAQYRRRDKNEPFWRQGKIHLPAVSSTDGGAKAAGHAKANGSGHSYLIQHSAGSGKSNSIAWLPHLSFFAFTATPKDKTLELFGVKDASVKKGFRPFHQYTMRQAIAEGFILDVLESYTTYKTYFELIETEKADGEKEVEKLKARRLMLQYVDQHEFAIKRKAHIIVDHFTRNTAHKIAGQAKAMVVTHSRAHAVLYKQALDEVVREQNLSFGVLVAANKFQTGFDQPLLHTMYVDKKLGGVAAVQTLSRLNRTFPPLKQDTMVLDFVNEQETIQASFQDYYQSTELEGETDPNKLYNLKYTLEKTGVFTPEDVAEFVELFVVKKVKSKRAAILRKGPPVM